jgi:hypothetical protein
MAQLLRTSKGALRGETLPMLGGRVLICLQSEIKFQQAHEVALEVEKQSDAESYHEKQRKINQSQEIYC